MAGPADSQRSQTADLLADLRVRGVKLWSERGQLRCTAPKGTLSEELKLEIKSRKDEIIAFLEAGSDLSQQHRTRIAPIPRDRSLPVSYSQQRLWFLDQFEPGTPVYNIPAAIRFKGFLDTFALERTIAEIVRRHESLRTNIVSVDGQPTSVIKPFNGWVLDVNDVQATPAGEREEHVRRVTAEVALKPFALATDPLFRATLLRVAPQDHVLIVVFHHIITDGWSIGIFLRELTVLYGAFIAGNPAPLTELPIQYVDYAAWQREWLEGDRLETQLRYWKSKLAGDLPVVALPFDRPRPALQTFRGAMTQAEVSADVANALRQFARKEKATLFMALLAGLSTLFYRYTGQQDVILGSSSANRSQIETEELIGFFINNLVLRTDLSGNPSFRELLARTREVAFEAEANQDAPFEKIVEAVQAARSLAYSPIFQVMFNFQNFPMDSFKLPGVSFTNVPLPAETTRFDLNLDIHETPPGKLTLTSTYNSDLFDKTTVDHLLKHFAQLLEAVVRDPDGRIGDLRLLAEDEQHRLVRDWNATAVEYARESTVVELFEEQVERAPESVAVVYGAEALTYRDLNARANQVAHHLRRLGVGPETLVGICVRRSPDMLVGLFGILKAGGAYIPLDPTYPKERLAFMLEDAAVRFLVTEDGCREELPENNARVVSLDGERGELSKEPRTSPERAASGKNLAYVIYTSGSTGRPKGVQIQHESVVNFLESMRREPGLKAADRLLSVTTISFDIFGLELYLPLTSGACLVLASQEETADAGRLSELLERSAATVMQATPATWRSLLESGWREGKKLKVLSGGEALTRDLADRLLATGAEVWNLYGPTETTIWSTLARVGESGVVPIGRPIANTRIYILDQGLKPVPVGVVGELYIGGAGLARGYLQRDELTAERFVADPFSHEAGARMYKTGDLARYRRDAMIECLGRVDHQVKIRGFRIELGEIEARLEKYPGFAQAVVVVRGETKADQRLVAYWSGPADPEPTTSELRRFLEETLPDYMVPSTFVRLDAFPLTPNGKVDRHRLPAPSGDRPTMESEYVAPGTELERAISVIWQDVLRLDKVGTNDNFFDLGGNSLLIVQVQNKMRTSLNKLVPLVEFFQRPTIGSLAELLSGEPVQSDSFDSVRDRAKKQRAALEEA